MVYAYICVILQRLARVPRKAGYVILSPKNFIAQQLQLCLFIIINRDENYSPEESKDFAI